MRVRRRPRSAMAPLALLALLLAATVRVAAWHGEVGPDSSVYAQYAWQLGHGELDLRLNDQYIHRLLVYAPLAPLYAWFGVSTLTTMAWPLLASLLQIGLAMLLAGRWFGRAAALFTGGLLAFYPLDVQQSALLLPDLPLGMLMSASAVMWFLGDGSGPRRSYGLALGAGVCLGLASSVRAYALVLLVVFLLDLWIAGARRRRWALAVAGAGAVWAAVFGIYAVAADDPLQPLRVTKLIYASGRLLEGARLDVYPKHLWPFWNPTGLYPLLCLGCVGLCLIQPDRQRVRLLVWIGTLAALLQFGSMSLTSYIPILKHTRFLTILTVPSVILAASVLAASGGWTREQRRWIPGPGRARKAVRAGLALGLAVGVTFSAIQIARDHGPTSTRGAAYRDVADHLRAAPSRTVAVDHWRTMIKLAYYLGFQEGAHHYEGSDDLTRMDLANLGQHGRFRYLSWYASAAQLQEGDWVVVDQSVQNELAKSAPAKRRQAQQIPPWAWPAPAGWSPVVDSAGLHLFEVESDR